MSGWIYCITNSLYKMDDMYKLGYTANKSCYDEVKQCLIHRYNTYFPNVECLDLFEVKQPIQAEKELFGLLKNYKNTNEIIKADYTLIIKPNLELIKNKYTLNSETILSQKEKNKYKNILVKKRKYFITHLFRIQQYLTSLLNTVNKHNSELICKTFNSLSYFNGITFPPIKDKKLLNFYKNDLINNISLCIENYDYNDKELIKFIEFIDSLV